MAETRASRMRAKTCARVRVRVRVRPRVRVGVRVRVRVGVRVSVSVRPTCVSCRLCCTRAHTQLRMLSGHTCTARCLVSIRKALVRVRLGFRAWVRVRVRVRGRVRDRGRVRGRVRVWLGLVWSRSP